MLLKGKLFFTNFSCFCVPQCLNETCTYLWRWQKLVKARKSRFNPQSSQRFLLFCIAVLENKQRKDHHNKSFRGSTISHTRSMWEGNAQTISQEIVNTYTPLNKRIQKTGSPKCEETCEFCWTENIFFKYFLIKKVPKDCKFSKKWRNTSLLWYTCLQNSWK